LRINVNAGFFFGATNDILPNILERIPRAALMLPITGLITAA